jgi:hypothetical protein
MSKTLVTIGCSLTYGEGSWGSLNERIDDYKELNRLRPLYFDRVMEYGWPNLVAKELGFNKLINLGRPGSSTSGQLKLFIEQDFNGQDIYVIWMLTSPERFSFYRSGQIVNINPTARSEFSDAYIKFLRYDSLDPCLEQLFYIKCMYDICKANNYKLILTYWDTACFLTQTLDTTKEFYLTPDHDTMLPYDPGLRSPVCNHPNEKGYKYMADKIISYIDINHNHFRVGKPVKKVDINFPKEKIFSSKVNII